MKITIEIPDEQIPENAKWLTLDPYGLKSWAKKPTKHSRYYWSDERSVSLPLGPQIVKVTRNA